MEEKTKNLTMEEKLDLVLTELADLRVWRAKVDAFMEERSRDTKPMLGQIHKDIAGTRIEMREGFEKMAERFSELEKPMALVREDARMAHRTTKLVFERESSGMTRNEIFRNWRSGLRNSKRPDAENG